MQSNNEIYKKIFQLERQGNYGEAALKWYEMLFAYKEDMNFCFYQHEACRMVEAMMIKKESAKEVITQFNWDSENEEMQLQLAVDLMTYQEGMLEKRRLVCLIGQILKNGNMPWDFLFRWSDEKISKFLNNKDV